MSAPATPPVWNVRIVSRAGLADRLRGNDAHRVADLGQLAGAEERAVAARQTPKSLLHLSTERTGSVISWANSPSSSTSTRTRAGVSSSPLEASFVLPGLPSLSGL